MLVLTKQTPIEAPKKLGGTNKARRVIKTRNDRENIESQFMRIAFVSNRAEQQKDLRQSKRK